MKSLDAMRPWMRSVPGCLWGRAVRMPDQLVTFDHVEVLDRGDMGFRCRIGERVVWVGYLQPQPGTTIDQPLPGDRLVLRRADAAELGLIAWTPAA